MWDLFLLPYTLLGWFFKYLFSAVVWFTLVMSIHYYVTENFTWRDFAIWKKFRSDNLLLFITLVPILYLSFYILLTIRQKFIQEFLANTGILERLKNFNFYKFYINTIFF